MINIDDGKPLILVAEDVEETRDGREELLKADGYRVDSARDEKVLRARREAPDLVLISLQSMQVDVIAAARPYARARN